MRYPIGYLDRVTEDGRVVEAAGFTWADEPLPLMAAPGTGTHEGAILLGTVTEIQTNPDGVVSAVLSHPIAGLGPGFDLDHVDFHEGPYGILVTTRARLRAVTLTPNPTWSGLLIR